MVKDISAFRCWRVILGKEEQEEEERRKGLYRFPRRPLVS